MKLEIGNPTSSRPRNEAVLRRASWKLGRRLSLASLMLGLGVLASAARAAEEGGTPVLDMERGSFRAFMSWRTPTLVAADGKRVPMRELKWQGVKDEDLKPIPVRESAAPAADWTAPGFDDSEWCRMRGAAVVPSDDADWNRVCIRGKFIVTDPAQVQGLRLDASYHGGIRVRVNGRELTRAHMAAPAGGAGTPELAERYPVEAYVRPDGKIYGAKDANDTVMAERIKLRIRTLTSADQKPGIAIPSDWLKKGINVVSIESLCAPINELALDAPMADKSPRREIWPHAGIVSATLTCAAAGGLSPNVGPVPGIRIGNVSPAETLTVWDYAHPAESLQPVRLIGARNGTFSGRVMLSSSETIRAPKATATELAQAGGAARIPANAIQIRWAEFGSAERSWGMEGRFDRLLSEPPAEVAPTKVGRAGKLSSALVPVWITVRVPADAVPGNYKGSVTVEAQGSAPATFTVPVELSVSAWKVPDPGDFTVINNICQSADSVAQFYKVQPWSDRHFELIGKSLDVFHQVGSRICSLNLIVRMHGYGNADSMVKWVKKEVPSVKGQGEEGSSKRTADGAVSPAPSSPRPSTLDPFDYDFSVADKYMDVYARTCGKPLVLQVNAWAFPGDNPAHPKWPQASVSVVDKNGKRLDDMLQPPYGTPENEAFWRPVFTELQKRLEKRGWFDVTHIGWLAYQSGPDKGIVNVAKAIWPNGKWIKNSHQVSKDFFGMPVPWNSSVWGAGYPYDPDCKTAWRQRPVYPPAGRLDYPKPWESEGVHVGNPRWGSGFARPGLYGPGSLMRYRDISESALQGNLRGMGQLGGDFWPVPIGDRGRLGTLCSGEGAVTPRVNTLALSSPGPDGAMFNERLEMFREGVQIAEAIIHLRKALEAKRVDETLAGRIAALLDARARRHLHNQNPLPVGPGSDPCLWLAGECMDGPAAEAELLALAGQVTGEKK